MPQNTIATVVAIIISRVLAMLAKGESATRLFGLVRGKQELELPKISKTLPLEQSFPLAEKYQWLIREKDYAPLSTADIEQEYQQLRRQLLLINQEAAREVEKINMKPLKRSRIEQPERIIEIREKEVENNLAIIARLRYEQQQLQKRTASIEATSKDELDTCIADAKDQITKLRIKNKQLKFKSKEIGDSIENGDKVFNEIQTLEMEREIAERRKTKLLERQHEVKSNYQKVVRNLQQISGDSQQAEEFIEEHLQSSRHFEGVMKLQSVYRQKSSQLQIVRRNCESIRNTKQQRYHILLKQLEAMVDKVQGEDQRINGSEETNLNQRRQIGELEEKLQQVLRKEREKKTDSGTNTAFFTEIEQKEGSSALSEDPIQNIKKKMGLSLKRNLSPARFNSKPNELSTNGIKLQQTEQKRHYSGRVAREQVQMVQNKTYVKMEPVAVLKVSTESAAKKTIEMHRGDINYSSFPKNIRSAKVNEHLQKQEIRTLPKVSNMTNHHLRQSEIKLKSAVNDSVVREETKFIAKRPKQQKAGPINKPSTNHQIIEQVLDASMDPHEFSNKQQHQQSISEQLPLLPNSSKSKIPALQQSPNKRQETHRYDPEQQDEDISAFQQSIKMQKQNMASGKIKIDIPLADIETSIRKSEQLSKLKKMAASPNTVIEEDEELPL